MKYALILLVFLGFPGWIYGQDTVQIPRNTFERAKQAADEVEAARVLIAAQEQQILSLKRLVELQTQKLRLQDDLSVLKDSQIALKDRVIADLSKENLVLQKRNDSLKKSNRNLKRIGTILGVTASVLGLIVFH